MILLNSYLLLKFLWQEPMKGSKGSQLSNYTCEDIYKDNGELLMSYLA